MIQYKRLPPSPTEHITTTEQDFVDHKALKPRMLTKTDKYYPPTAALDGNTIYKSAFDKKLLTEPAKRRPNLRPKTEMDIPHQERLPRVKTLHEDEFKSWPCQPRQRHFGEPLDCAHAARCYTRTDIKGLTTFRADFGNEKLLRAAKPSTSCKKEEKAVLCSEPFDGRTTMKASFLGQPLVPDNIYHRHMRKGKPLRRSEPMELHSHYDSKFGPYFKQPRRRSMCLPNPDELEISPDRYMVWSTEQRAAFKGQFEPPVQPIKPVEQTHFRKAPFSDSTTHKACFADPGHPMPTLELRPQTQTAQVGEISLQTTHREQFKGEGVKRRERHGDQHELHFLVPPAQISDRTTVRVDYTEKPPCAATPCKPLDERAKKGDIDKLRGLPGGKGNTCYEESFKKYSYKPRQCPAATLK